LPTENFFTTTLQAALTVPPLQEPTSPPLQIKQANETDQLYGNLLVIQFKLAVDYFDFTRQQL